MLKPLTLSLSLAVALVAGSVAKAGGHGHVAPAPQAIPSAQVLPTEQVIPSAQCYSECLPAKKCFDLSGLGHKVKGLGHGLKSCIPTIHLPKIPAKTYTYEWVLQKKRCGGGLMGLLGKHGHGDICGGGDVCGDAGVYATGQTLSSPQGVYAAGQGGGAFGTGQIYGGGATGQMPAADVAPGVMEPAPVETDAAPDAPVVPSSYSVGR